MTTGNLDAALSHTRRTLPRRQGLDHGHRAYWHAVFTPSWRPQGDLPTDRKTTNSWPSGPRRVMTPWTVSRRRGVLQGRVTVQKRR